MIFFVISGASKSCLVLLWVIFISFSCLNIHKILEALAYFILHSSCKYCLPLPYYVPTLSGGWGGGVGVYSFWCGSCLHWHSVLSARINGWMLTKFTQIYHWVGEKRCLDFGDLDSIFKVTGGLKLLENSLSAFCLLKEWMDFDQTCRGGQVM